MKRTRNHIQKAHITAGVLSIAGCFLMVAFPKLTMETCKEGFDLFLNSVFPTLFPFFVLVNFLVFLGIPERLGQAFEGLFRCLFGCGGLGAVITVLSMFSGYPMASKLVGDYIRNGRISREEGRKILSFASVSGPLFLVGTVGTAMLGSTKDGYLMALSHYVAAMINGLIFCRWVWSSDHVPNIHHSSLNRPWDGSSLAEGIGSSILSAIRSLSQIGGYIILFSIIIGFLKDFGILNVFPAQWQGTLVTGLLEMTTGCYGAVTTEGISKPLKLALCSGFVSFGGLSIAGQSLSMLHETGIRTSDYFWIKCCHGCIAAAMCMALAMYTGK